MYLFALKESNKTYERFFEFEIFGRGVNALMLPTLSIKKEMNTGHDGNNKPYNDFAGTIILGRVKQTILDGELLAEGQ